uniref:TetR family transcriptional regulator n=1 Tax=uncultured Allobacillus sp. TaxID=1638025 RepID=UPI00259797AA|nr:TetR family transcriptional regulator [uncultured Allobacillus sp.]
MNDKKTMIIEASIELFAKKGFHTTSVQEIVNKANVAKGSFYTYFQSKDELIVSIYTYYSNLTQNKMDDVKSRIDDPREAFKEQLEIFFELLKSNKSLIVMLLQGQISIDKNMESLIQQSKQKNFKWAKENLSAIYGETFEAYINDAAILLNGIIHGYAAWLVSDNANFDTEQLAAFTMRRLDDVCFGMQRQEEEPMIKELPDYLHEKALIIQEIEWKLMNEIDADEVTEKAIEAIHVLGEEIQKDQPQSVVIQSMLQLIEQVEETKKETSRLRRLIE